MLFEEIMVDHNEGGFPPSVYRQKAASIKAA